MNTFKSTSYQSSNSRADHSFYSNNSTDSFDSCKSNEPIAPIVPPIENEFPEISSWDELDIPADLLRGIYAYGYEKPSPIQCKSITPLLAGRDVIAQAQSGTGKTAVFAVGVLNTIDLADKNVQAIILSPTRELSTQTSKFVNKFGTMMTGLSIQTLIGGSYIEDDISSYKKTLPQVIIGCPGRVYDMMRRNVFNSKKIKIIAIDEADEMLSSGFKEQLYNIFQRFSNTIQVALFSATLPENIFEITNKIMRNPVTITVKPEKLTLDGIAQYFVAMNDDQQKYSTLKDLFSYFSVSQCMIYCNSVKRVIDLHSAMCSDDFPVCCIHSNMEKHERDRTMEEFRSGQSRVLISSNVTARGIDVQQVSIVINFDVPKCVHTYLHRIGRSGRWGRKGVGINFITRRDIQKIKDIEEHYSCVINELPSNLNELLG